MNHKKLAFNATLHCLAGCGLGEVAGFMLGTFFGLPYIAGIALGLFLGFVFGYLFGIIPLLNHLSFLQAGKIVATSETLSIVVMETAEAIIELIFPGMKQAGFTHLTYWLGLFTALSVGFAAAFPVNLYLVKKGVKHHH